MIKSVKIAKANNLVMLFFYTFLYSFFFIVTGYSCWLWVASDPSPCKSAVPSQSKCLYISVGVLAKKTPGLDFSESFFKKGQSDCNLGSPPALVKDNNRYQKLQFTALSLFHVVQLRQLNKLPQQFIQGST